MCEYMALFERIRKYGLVGENESPGVSYDISKAHDRPCVFFLLPEDLDVKFPTTSLAPSLPECHHAPYHDNHRLNLLKYTQAIIKCFLLEKFPWSLCLFTAIEQ